jgi:hypothetical protein
MNTDELIRTITAQTVTLAAKTFGDLKGRTAVAAIREFLAESKPDIERWLGELQRKEITSSDFNDLIFDAMADAELLALQRVSAANVEKDKFKAEMVSLITSLAMSAIKSAI